jgi:hypothetical protein
MMESGSFRETRKMLAVGAAESPASGARCVGRALYADKFGSSQLLVWSDSFTLKTIPVESYKNFIIRETFSARFC